MPDLSLQNEGAYFESLVRVQADSTVGNGAGMCPVKQIGVRAYAGVILREADGLVFDDFAAIEGSIGLLLFRNNSDCHGVVFEWENIRWRPFQLPGGTQ